MKRHILFPSILLCLLVHLAGAQNQISPATGSPSTSWGALQLTNAAYKMPAHFQQPRLLIGITGMLQPGAPESGFSAEQFGQLQAALFEQPAIWEQLHGQLNGEFWIGNFSQPGVFGPESSSALRSFGLRVILPIARHWALQTTVAKGQASVRAPFPVTVVSQLQGQSRQLEGFAERQIGQVQAQISGRYFFFRPAAVQVYGGIGGAFNHQSGGMATASLENVQWVFGSGTANSSFSILAETGLLLQARNLPVFAELGASVQQQLGGKRKLALQATVGWKW